MFSIKKKRVGSAGIHIGQASPAVLRTSSVNSHASHASQHGVVRMAGGDYGMAFNPASGSNFDSIHGTSVPYSRTGPVRARIERGSVVHDWIPTDLRTQNKLMRLIYSTDAVAGSAIDYYREIPFGKIILGGLKDHKRQQFCEEALDALNIQRFLPFMATDLLVVGRLISHLIFDSNKGYWTDIINHDSDFISVQPNPIMGEEPMIDLLVPPEYRQWATSPDPRAIKSRKRLDPKLIKLMAAGGSIPLSPENTIFVPRRMSSNDVSGTSLLFRILPIVILEFALLDCEATGMRRRAAPVWVAKMGIEDKWEPGPDEMQEMHDMMTATEEDPAGAKLIIRNGVEFETVSGPAELAKYGEQWSWIKEAKLQGLGMNEAFATGETSWNFAEAMLSLGMERIRNFRNFMATEVLLEGILAPLTRLHGHYKRTQAEINHRVRTSARTDANLDLPTIEWDRSLKPSADRDYLDMLSMLEEKGVPVNVRQWAQAGGFDLEEALHGMSADLELRKKIKAYTDAKESIGGTGEGEGEGEEGGEEEAGGAPTKLPTKEPESKEEPKEAPANFRGSDANMVLANRVANLSVWNHAGEFAQLRKGDVITLLQGLPNRWLRIAKSGWERIGKDLTTRGLQAPQVEALQYCLARVGAVKEPLAPRAIVAARDELLKRLNGQAPNRLVMREIYWLNHELERLNPLDPEAALHGVDSAVQRTADWMKPAGSDLLTGTLTKEQHDRIKQCD